MKKKLPPSGKPKIKISPARPADVSALLWLNRLFAPEVDDPPPPTTARHMARTLFGKDRYAYWWLARVKSQPAGYATMARRPDWAHGQVNFYLTDLFVKRAFRSKGVADALMRRLASEVLKRRGAYLLWDVYRPNRRAYAFYEAIGARHVRSVTLMFIREPRLAKMKRGAERLRGHALRQQQRLRPPTF